jgi:hypothetical protein
MFLGTTILLSRLAHFADDRWWLAIIILIREGSLLGAGNLA